MQHVDQSLYSLYIAFCRRGIKSLPMYIYEVKKINIEKEIISLRERELERKRGRRERKEKEKK